jgi:NADPH2:quinone reductase
MRAVQMAATGGPEVLQLVDLPTPQPAPGTVRVKHAAIGLNFIDTYQRSGLYPMKLPAILGGEGAGVVDAVGEGVGEFKVGDRIAYASGGSGGYAEYATVHASRAILLPDDISFEVAAAALLKGMTAEFLLLRCFPVQAGQTVLIQAAAGGVGTIMVQWAKALGATVIGTAGSPEKADLARRLGCDHVILYRSEDVPGRVREITGGAGVPVVYDSVGAATFEGSLQSLARRGMMISFGNASGPVPPVPPLRLMQGGSLFLTRPTMADYTATVEDLRMSAGTLFAAIASGAVKIEIGQTFPLADARRAHESLQGRKTTGASLLIP